MALGIEMERKRDAAQMSAAAVSFFLDHEGRKTFLKTTTNQELEAENTALKAEIQKLEEKRLLVHRSRHPSTSSRHPSTSWTCSFLTAGANPDGIESRGRSQEDPNIIIQKASTAIACSL